MKASNQLGEEKISRLLLKFSVPAITGMLVNALYNVMDRAFIGHGVGSLGIAGITIGFPIMMVAMAFGMLFGIGATAMMSIKLGQKKKSEAELIMGNGMTLLVISGITLAVLGIIFLNPILKIFGASEEVLPYARDFMKIILIGNVFQAVSFGMNNFIRADGKPLIAMFTMLIGSICNAILGPLFIFVFKWGVSGAAFATVISQGVSAIWVMSYFISGKSTLKLHLKNLKLQSKIVKGITAIGIAPFSMQLAASLLNVILNNSLQVYGGDIAISAMGLVTSINMLILMPIFGINQGAQPIIGYNYGARQYKRVKETLKLAITAATVIVVLGFLATQFLSYQLIGIFNNKDVELLNVGAKTLRIYLMFLPIIGFQIVSANYFQAVGKPKQAMILSLSRQVLLLIPAIIILPHFFGFNGILAAGPLADFLSSVLTGIWLFLELRHLDNIHRENEDSEAAME